MSNNDEKEGGILLGGISFGVGPSPSDDAADDKTAEMPAPITEEPPLGAPPEDAVATEAGGVREQQPLMTLRVLAVADLIPQDSFNRGARAPEAPITLHGRDIEDVFRALSPRLALEVPSVLGGLARIDLDLSGMKSFRPDSLCAEIPLLSRLVEGKQVLEQLRDGSLTVPIAQQKLGELWEHSAFVGEVLGGVEHVAPRKTAPLSPPVAETNDDDVSRLLDMVDTGSEAPSGGATSSSSAGGSSGQGRFDAFLSTIAHSGKSDEPGARPAEAIRTVEQALGLQIGAIVQHEEFRRLETAWRGLDFLIRRAPKDKIRIDILSAPEDGRANAIDAAINADLGHAPPVSYVIADSIIEADAVSMQRFRALADVGEQNAVPIIANAAVTLLGAQSLTRIDRLDNKASLFEAPERAPWRKEAHRPAARWLTLVTNRILSRGAYDARSSRVREASVQEQPNDEAATVWMNPCWAVGTLPLASFDRYQWPHRVTGAPEGGVVENLPVREVSSGYESETVAIPTEALLSIETQRALGRLGVLALSCQPNGDAVHVMTAPTSYVPEPKRTYDSAGIDSQDRAPIAPLVDQLFVARLAGFLMTLGRRVGASSAPHEVKDVIEAALWELFDTARPGSVELITDVSSADGGVSATVTVRPRGFLGVSMEEITLGVPLG